MAGGADPISMGLQVAERAASAIDQHQQLRAAAKADRENARRTELQGAFDEMALRRRERATSGEALAAQGGSGLAVGTGSAMDLLLANALERERGVEAVQLNAGGKADALRQEAKAKKRAATMALIGGFLGAGAKAMAGMDRMEARRDVPGGYRFPAPSAGILPGDQPGIEPVPPLGSDVLSWPGVKSPFFDLPGRSGW